MGRLKFYLSYLQYLPFSHSCRSQRHSEQANRPTTEKWQSAIYQELIALLFLDIEMEDNNERDNEAKPRYKTGDQENATLNEEKVGEPQSTRAKYVLKKTS